jgi:hypothetical protein
MGRIKSALEIAMERTESVQGDKSSIDQYEARQKGKKLANAFLEGGKSLEEELKKAGDQRENLKQGIFDVLISQVVLPGSKEDEKRIEAVGRGLQTLIDGNRFASMYKQFLQLVSRYLDDISRYEDAILRQYEPKIRAREDELSRRLGRQVKIDPFQDPEFAAFYNQNMNALREKYQAAVDETRAETMRLFAGA